MKPASKTLKWKTRIKCNKIDIKNINNKIGSFTPRSKSIVLELISEEKLSMLVIIKNRNNNKNGH